MRTFLGTARVLTCQDAGQLRALLHNQADLDATCTKQDYSLGSKHVAALFSHAFDEHSHLVQPLVDARADLFANTESQRTAIEIAA